MTAVDRDLRQDSSGTRGFRDDIEGLRGVAVLAVVLYHAGVPQLSGGYVGVDVFFVLSGFLITGLIVSEVQRTGRFSFLAFYARRARRILPASTLVLLVTLACSVAWLAPLQARSVTRDSIASALFVSNYRFAAVGTDYLAAAAPSPLQHYWSLCIEEQFYLLWPALLVGITLAGRRLRAGTGVTATVLGGLALASFCYGAHLTSSNPPWAYFSLAARGWELAAGGLLYLAMPRLRRCPAPLARSIGWAGLALLGYAVLSFGAGTAFPGAAALLPVAATVAIVAAGGAWSTSARTAGPPLTSASRLLGTAPLRYAGRVSYSWYLWHWPVLMLAPALLGHPLRLPQALALCAASAVLAALTLRLVENPVRYASRLRSRPRLAVLLAVALVLTGVGGSYGAEARLPSLAGHGVAASPVSPVSLGGQAALGSGGHPRPGSAVTALDPLRSADDRIAAALRTALARSTVPGNLDPSLQDAASDKAAPFVDGCNLTWTAVEQPRCTYTSGSRRIVLFGDSHAAQWFPALQQIAGQRHWQLESFTKTTCPPNELALVSPYLGHEYTECSQWRAAILARLRAERPALVVLGVARHYSADYHLSVYDHAWNAGLAGTVAAIRAIGATVLVMGPTPKPPADVPSCLSQHTANATACTFDYRTGVQAAGMDRERRAVEQAGGAYLDVPSWICTSGRCAVLVGNLLVYRDDNHLTTSFTRWLAPALSLAVDAALHRSALPH